MALAARRGTDSDEIALAVTRLDGGYLKAKIARDCSG